MKASDFDYSLPRELIAQTPAEPRDSSRLLVLRREGGSLKHRHFGALPHLLQPGDLLVVNDSRVVPARLVGRRPTGGRVELLLLRREAPARWQCLARPGRRLRPGTAITFDDSDLHAEVVERTGEGSFLVAFSQEPPLHRLGQIALPPYIRTPLAAPGRYQTVYARSEGSLAAPTAGLHFTPGLLQALAQRGIETVAITLHIGPATFLPVRAEDPHHHPMPPEYCELGEAAASAIVRARAAGRRVVAVGTSVVRVLEAAALRGPQGNTHPARAGTRGSTGSPRTDVNAARPEPVEGRLAPFSGWNDLLILPGHRFQAVDALITNFHLPRSTNLMLVAAFAGWERLRAAYAEAIAQGYRFYSFGDAMLVL